MGIRTSTHLSSVDISQGVSKTILPNARDYKLPREKLLHISGTFQSRFLNELDQY